MYMKEISALSQPQNFLKNKKGYIPDDIAYVNVKKECKNKVQFSHKDIIYHYAQKDKEQLKQLIDLISFDVVFVIK